MKTFEISSIAADEVLRQLGKKLNSEIKEEWGEYTLHFDNEHGVGTIRGVSFDWGVSLIDYDVNFTDDIKIIFHIKDLSPIEFVFVSEGSLKYSNEETEEMDFERYQNIIISPKANSKKIFQFPKEVQVKANFIQIIKNDYTKKKNNNLTYLNEVLLNVFKDESPSLPYNHAGNYNLKIADQVKELQESKDSGIVRTLSLEGRLNLILAMQLVEHQNFQDKEVMPDSLSRRDIKKIHQLTEFILDNISAPLTIENLSRESGLNAKKLQAGFKMLYNNTVNEYIRHLKLEIARDELKNSDDTISEIVYNIGFKSRSYFSKIFSERYGILPMEYRKSIKNTPKP
ncbi:hypothetical protein GCM10009117_12860 [Gangjinia marincola]|uniref:HTH araC/xylS-type domain-containing protein n=1 Tax=Gangjinia marincola TaxID=578463 RepID=A0ABP3XWB5_9FLAO